MLVPPLDGGGRRRPPAAGRALTLTVGVLLALLTLASLGGVVRNGFVNYDDDLYVTANPDLARGPGLAGLRWAFTTTRGGNWHPLTWVSHLIDVRLFGLRPAGHHAVGLALHVVNVWLLFALLHRLTGARWPAALVAALFAVHPLHVESVAWAAERKDLLSTLFALAAAHAYVGGVRRPGAPAARAWAAALLALALLAKPMPVTLPLLLLVADWWPLGRWSPVRGAPPHVPRLPPRALWREKAPLLALAVAAAAVTWVVQRGAGAMSAGAAVPLPARVANAVVAGAAYLRSAVWPVDLAVFYPYPWGGNRPPVVALALLTLVALALLAWRAARERPWIAAGLLWYAVALAPVLGLVQVGEQARADRYTYLPLTGAFIAAAWSLAAVASRGRRFAIPVAAAALAGLWLLGALSARQVRVWRDGSALFTHAIAATRDNYVAHNNLGSALLARGRAAEALPHFAKTIRTRGTSPKGHQNLGRALAALGRHEEAIDAYRRAIERDPTDPLVWRNLGLSLAAAGRREEAIAAWREAVQRNPRDARTLDLLGVALARAGRAVEAVPLLAAAAALAPDDATIRDHLAVARAQVTAKPSRTDAPDP